MCKSNAIRLHLRGIEVLMSYTATVTTIDAQGQAHAAVWTEGDSTPAGIGQGVSPEKAIQTAVEAAQPVLWLVATSRSIEWPHGT